MLCNVSKELAIPQTLRARLQGNLGESWFRGFRMVHMAANKQLARLKANLDESWLLRIQDRAHGRNLCYVM